MGQVLLGKNSGFTPQLKWAELVFSTSGQEETAMSIITRTVDRFLAQVDIPIGPTELITRVIIKGVTAAAERGVYLELTTFDELMSVNSQNLESWRPLSTSWQPGVGHANNNTGYVIIGRNIDDQVMTTTAIQYLDWRHTDFKTEAESLRFFYLDPAANAGRDEACQVSDEGKGALSERTLHTGAGWFHSDMRGLQLTNIIPRVSRAYAAGRWQVDSAFGVISEYNCSRQFHKRIGLIEDVAAVTFENSPSYPGQAVKLRLVRMSLNEIYNDSVRFLLDFNSEAAVDQRSA